MGEIALPKYDILTNIEIRKGGNTQFGNKKKYCGPAIYTTTQRNSTQHIQMEATLAPAYIEIIK